MKNLKQLILILPIILVLSCKDCPECFSISEPVRIVFVDADGTNLLINDSLQINLVMFCEGTTIGFDKNSSPSSPETTHIELGNEVLHDSCENDECCIEIRFEDEVRDILEYKIERQESRCCTSYRVSKFTYNGIDYLEQGSNQFGAYVIEK